MKALLGGKTCGDCPFWCHDLDLCTRKPLDRGDCVIDEEHHKRTHVRRAICDKAKPYFAAMAKQEERLTASVRLGGCPDAVENRREERES